MNVVLTGTHGLRDLLQLVAGHFDIADLKDLGEQLGRLVHLVEIVL